MNRHTTKAATIGFVLTFLLLVVSAALSYRNTRRLAEADQSVRHTHQVLHELATVLSTLKDAETGQRGFIITQDDQYLRPYLDAVGRVHGQFVQLDERIADNPSQQDRLAVLRQRVDAKLAEFERTVALLKETKDFKAVQAIVRTNEGKREMDAVRDIVGQMQKEENDLLRQRAEESERSYRTVVLLNLLTSLLSLALVGLTYYLVHRILALRQRAAQKVAEERERFRVTLASIGDAVLVTDARGRITFLNAVAEGLTGWKEDALGREIAEVFHIVNEQSGAAVEDPVAKVIAQGTIVGLANHTILLSRDGRRIPIDDSGAPVRDATGEIAGVVLVFRDVSGRQNAEREMRQSEERFHLLADSIPQLTWMARPDGHVYWYNKRWYDYTGTTPEQMVGWGWQSVHDPAELPRVLERWKASLQSGEPLDMVFPLRGADGTFRSFLTRVAPLRGGDGRILHWFGTNTDISERMQMEETLREADRLKDEFLATLAHELRNPLAPIRNAIQILRLAQGNGEVIEQARSMMDRQLQQVVRLVDDLLDVSRITRGKLTLDKKPVELAEVLNAALETCQPHVEAGSHRLTVALPPPSIRLDADKTRLSQAFSNILTNAVKYTPPGGRIELTAREQGREVVVTIEDSGIGIPANMLERIFDMFAQVDQTLERAQGGLGVGLTLVKRLVEMHGGRVEARSEGHGRGSFFVVHLPILATEPRSEGPPARVAERVSSALRIVVVDDNQDATDSLALLLRMMGHDVRTAQDGPAALEAVNAFRPRLVLCDLGMPGMSGYEVARRLGEQPHRKELLLVALTGYGGARHRKQTEDAGFDHHLVKPVELEALQALLARLNSNAAASR